MQGLKKLANLAFELSHLTPTLLLFPIHHIRNLNHPSGRKSLAFPGFCSPYRSVPSLSTNPSRLHRVSSQVMCVRLGAPRIELDFS